jgi:N-dimethylarginine dimethylaminohydrolase
VKVSTKNEYGELKSVILGNALNMVWPMDDNEFNNAIDRSTYHKRLVVGPVPQNVVHEAEEDLEKLSKIMQSHGVAVHRPVEVKKHWAYSARDILLTVGNKIIQCPTPFSSRANELDLYPFLIDSDNTIIKAPRPTESNDPVFDAANVIKLDDKLIYSLSHSANEAGAEWLQQQVGTEFEVIKWRVVDHDITHIDSTMLPLDKNTILVNASRVKEDQLPAFVKDFRKIWVDDVVARDFFNFPYASKWIGMNVLSLNPETVILDDMQAPLEKKLTENGFQVITTSMRQSRTLGGGFHCVTNDLVRE